MSAISVKKSSVIVLIVLLVGVIFWYLLTTRPAVQTVNTTTKRWLVNVEQIEPTTHTPYVVLYGKVESLQTSELEAAITADVLARPIKEGEHVKKGQLLIKLDDRDATLLLQERQAEVAELEAEIATEHDRDDSNRKALEHDKALLVIVQREVERWKHLEEKQAGSASRLDKELEALRRQHLAVNQRELALKDHQNRIKQLQARLQKTKAMQAQAELDMERTQIVAPFAGIVTKVFVAVGERVQHGEQLVKMFDDYAMEIRAQIPTQYLPMIKQALSDGEHLAATGDSETQQLKLSLDRLAGQVETGRAGVDGLFKVLEGGQRLALGRTVTIHLNLPKQQDVYAVPMQALYGADTIYKVVDDYLVAVTIQRIGIARVAEQQDPSVLIKSEHLTAGDRIVINQLPNAMSGLAVSIAKD